MEIGIDSFAKKTQTNEGGGISDNARAMNELIERIVHADKVGLDIFGIGEHHREEFLDSAAHNILSAAAAKTESIRLTSAVAVISAMDPVRLFQNYATLDLISNGRAEIVAGRGSFTEAFPLFGLDFADYDNLYAEKLDLLLKIRDEELVTWSGNFRPPLEDQKIYPRPLQEKLPVWVGVGGTPASFVRAGELGLPLMVAVIGGETHRFRPLVDLYYEAAEKAGHDKSSLKVGLHSLGFVANSKEEAIEKSINSTGSTEKQGVGADGHAKVGDVVAGATVIETAPDVVGFPELVTVIVAVLSLVMSSAVPLHVH